MTVLASTGVEQPVEAPRGRPAARPRPVAVRRPHVVSPGASPRLTPTACKLEEPRRRTGLLVALGVAVALAVAGLGVLGNLSAQANVPTETATVRVGVGEGLWDVAARMAPDADRAAVVDRIKELNHLDSASVRPGQQLTVPVRRK